MSESLFTDDDNSSNNFSNSAITKSNNSAIIFMNDGNKSMITRIIIEKPKRPLSAYNLFFQRERKQIVSEIEKEELRVLKQSSDSSKKELTTGKKRKGKKGRNSVTSGKVGFKRLACMIATKWKQIDPSDLEYYKKIASQQKIKYTEKMKLWRREKSSYHHLSSSLSSEEKAYNDHIIENRVLEFTKKNEKIGSIMKPIPMRSLCSNNSSSIIRPKNLPPGFCLRKPDISELARRLDDDCQNFLKLLLKDSF